MEEREREREKYGTKSQSTPHKQPLAVAVFLFLTQEGELQLNVCPQKTLHNITPIPEQNIPHRDFISSIMGSGGFFPWMSERWQKLYPLRSLATYSNQKVRVKSRQKSQFLGYMYACSN